MSLTTVSFSARKGIKVGGIILIALPIVWGILSGGIKVYKKSHPIQEEANVRYGNLPKIEFPEKKFEVKNFSLELANDKLPDLGKQARVYVVFRTDKNFLALETETKTAKELGFETNSRLISPNIYEFTNSSNQKLIVNILDGSFRLSYPYAQDQALMSSAQLPSKEALISKAKLFLEQAKKLPNDIKDGENKISYWKNEGSGLKQVSSPSEANMARIDLYRSSVNEDLKIVSTDINRAPISILISASSVNGKDIVDVDYKYVNIDRNSFATYPIRSTNEAFADLSSGEYWPAADVADKDIIIQKVSLSYFEPANLTNFMQPVYVFEGIDKKGNKFIAYVRAVSAKFTR
jgi:hypothetical protein